MNVRATTVFSLCLLAGWCTVAQAQTRTDVIWARDVAGATLTLDGQLDEAAWQQADSIHFRWDEPLGEPGSGQKVGGNLAAPSDPVDAKLYVLRDGNVLWLGLHANDKSVGGGRALHAGNWWFDGLIMSLKSRAKFNPNENPDDYNYFANGDNAEFFYSWWNPADTLADGSQTPGIAPRFFGEYGVGWTEGIDGPGRTTEDMAVWDARTVVLGGESNSDVAGEDEGYVMEMRIDAGAMGYDFTQAGGDRMGWSIAVQDADYMWPTDDALFFVQRVWWQSQWGNNFNEGVAYIAGSPTVTIATPGPLPAYPPDYIIPNGEAMAAPTINGMLDDDVWSQVEPAFQLKYADFDVMNTLPGLGPYAVSYFFPDGVNGEAPNPPVVDPSLARVHLFFRGDKLYLGVDVDDQAISGTQVNDGRDGIRLSINARNAYDPDTSLQVMQFDFTIDSTGTLRLAGAAALLQETDPGALVAAAALKGSSTPADPTDVDEGYTIEAEIDLVRALGYPAGRGDGWFWTGVNFYDGDFFEDETSSYAMRTWFGREGSDGPAAWGYMDPSVAVATEREPGELPETIALLGNYPNPFNPSTVLAYSLPQSGTVRIDVFDALGRRVTTLTPGAQSVGVNRVAFDAAGLASGLYFYQVQVTNPATGRVHQSAAGPMMLLK